MLPLTFDLAMMRSHCLNPKWPSNIRGIQWPAYQLKSHLLIASTTRSHFLHLSFYCTPLQDGRDKCEQEHNNCTTVSVSKGVPFFQVISKGSLVSSQHRKLSSAYLSVIQFGRIGTLLVFIFIIFCPNQSLSSKVLKDDVIVTRDKQLQKHSSVVVFPWTHFCAVLFSYRREVNKEQTALQWAIITVYDIIYIYIYFFPSISFS